MYGFAPPSRPALRTALAAVHRDRGWWHKVLVGGALWLTLVGYPVVEGFQVESIENTQNGFPTPLPRWNSFGLKAIQGIFALVIDFFFFVFPLLAGGMLLLCVAFGLTITNISRETLGALLQVGAALIGVWLLIAWISGVSPVAKRTFAKHGEPERVLGGAVLRAVWEPTARGTYLRARLHSAPTYLPTLALFAAAWLSSGRSGWLALLLLWLALSALLYARLVTIQLFDAAARQIEQRRFAEFQSRTRA